MKKTWLIALAAALTLSAQGMAQSAEKSAPKVDRTEFLVWGLGGLSTYSYSPEVGELNMGFGGGGGVGVGRFFTPNLGVKIGLEFMTYSSTFKADQFTTEYTIFNPTQDFNYRSRFVGYKETQKLSMLNIPLMFAYEQGMLYANLGVKMGLQFGSSFKATADSIITSAYIGEWDATYTNLPSSGFTKFSNVKSDGSLNIGFSLALAGEFGVKFQLSQRLNLYTGIYADYGLLNLVSKSKDPMIDYNSTLSGNVAYNSVLNSALRKTMYEDKNIVDRVSILGAGIKVALGFNSSTLLASADKDTRDDAYQAEATTHSSSSSSSTTSSTTSSTSSTTATELTKEEKKQLKAEKEEQEKQAKEQEKAAKEKEKQEKQASKDRAKLTPKQQQMEDDIAELKRVQEILMQQAENNNKNQEAILGAVKAAQEAALAAAQAAKAAQDAVTTMQKKDAQASEKSKARVSKDASNLNFKIQISARRSKLDDINAPFAKYDLNLRITEERYEDDTKTFIYKYVVGSYPLVETAVEVCNEIRDKGIKDAFVVAYYRGKRISMQEAFNILNKN